MMDTLAQTCEAAQTCAYSAAHVFLQNESAQPLTLRHGSSRPLRRRERLPAEQIEEITKRLYSDGLERLV